ncbi:hypothetical protein [Undibacterium oligocarboniphilum]|uniref:Uncharacterized protein n=1 Tax=Undibacterium oligocarboniphilum TaxID=666702 RepID=A0A850QKA0_9BURK|nr:hypothetical protein [Undibacterium oligocarboniphilum]MBC3871889.1 hypothetical protein [Undibacterium oligocarboniphilum]NVO79489.1 hypothetical protein [Undibacterium oligocarboniphilum]
MELSNLAIILLSTQLITAIVSVVLGLCCFAGIKQDHKKIRNPHPYLSSSHITGQR